MLPDLSSPLRPSRSPLPRVHVPAAPLSDRDRRILALALQKLAGAPRGFGEALRAVHEAVEELIPAGRVYLLGAANRGPIVGSLVSGVGITPSAEGVLVVRVDPLGRWRALGSLVA